MIGSQCLFHYCQRSAICRLCPSVISVSLDQRSKKIETDCNICMVWSEDLLTNSQRPPTQLFRFLILILLGKKRRQVIEALCHIRVARSQRFFSNAQRSATQRLRS